jgi:hypothetical protein
VAHPSPTLSLLSGLRSIDGLSAISPTRDSFSATALYPSKAGKCRHNVKLLPVSSKLTLAMTPINCARRVMTTYAAMHVNAPSLLTNHFCSSFRYEQEQQSHRDLRPGSKVLELSVPISIVDLFVIVKSKEIVPSWS